MKCIKCNNDLEANARFCRFCGNKIEFTNVANSCSTPETNQSAFGIVQEQDIIETANGTEITNYSDNDSYNEEYDGEYESDSDSDDVIPEKEYRFPDFDSMDPEANNSIPKEKHSSPIGVIVVTGLIVAGIAVLLAMIQPARKGVDLPYDNYTYEEPEITVRNPVYNEPVIEEYEDPDPEYYEPVIEEPEIPDYEYYEPVIEEQKIPVPEYNEPVAEEPPLVFPQNNGYNDSSKKLIIAYGGLRLRDAPDINATQVGLILDGSIVTIEQINGDWAYTCFEGVYGWCHRDYLFEPSSYSMSTLCSAMVTEYIGTELTTDKYFNNENVKTIIPNGFTVYVYEISGNRAFVSYNNVYGWCSTEYLVLS